MLRYNLGSMAFGSLILAVVEVLAWPNPDPNPSPNPSPNPNPNPSPNPNPNPNPNPEPIPDPNPNPNPTPFPNQVLVWLLEVIDEQTKADQQSNPVMKFTLKCCKCCLICFERCIKFVSSYAYIFVFMQVGVLGLD